MSGAAVPTESCRPVSWHSCVVGLRSVRGEIADHVVAVVFHLRVTWTAVLEAHLQRYAFSAHGECRNAQR